MRFEIIPAANGFICQITVGDNVGLYLASDEAELKIVITKATSDYLKSIRVEDQTPVTESENVRPNRAARRRANRD